MPQVIVKGKVVESEGPKSFKTDKGDLVTFQVALVRVGETVFRFKFDPAVEVKKHLDKEVSLTCVLMRGDNYSPSLKVVSVN